MSKDTKLKKVTRREITKLLYKLGEEYHSADDAGNALTRLECLAHLIWKKALGWIETDKDGKDVEHLPDRAFVTMLLERIEGRVPIATLQTDDGQGSVLADKIDEQAKARLNEYAN